MEHGSTHLSRKRLKCNPLRGTFPDFSTSELWYPSVSVLEALVEKLKKGSQTWDL